MKKEHFPGIIAHWLDWIARFLPSGISRVQEIAEGGSR
jgi:hypothetical protein